jgi:Sec-independent protein secretion pathway component TatC
MRGMRLAAVAGFLVAVPFALYGVWLIATPDYDGGRRPVGALVLVFAVPLLLACSWAATRPRGGRSR